LIETSLRMKHGQPSRLSLVCSLACLAAVFGALAREGWRTTRFSVPDAYYPAAGQLARWDGTPNDLSWTSWGWSHLAMRKPSQGVT
jgi:hypothetical protein